MDNEKTKVNKETKPVSSSALDYLVSDEAVSSMQGNYEGLITQADQFVSNARQSAAATRDYQVTRANNEYDTQFNTAIRNSSAQRMALREGRGIATAQQQFLVFDGTVNDQLNYLSKQKDEALRAADSDYYSAITNAQVEAINMKNQAYQGFLQNMFGVAGIQQTQQSFEFQRDQAIGNVALEFGLEVQPDDTLESIITRAAPLASEERRLQLDQIRAQIAQANASAAAARQQIAEGKRASNLTADEVLTLKAAGMENSLPEGYLFKMDPTERGKVLSKEVDLITGGLQTDIKNFVDSNPNASDQDIIDTIVADNYGVVTVQMVQDALGKRKDIIEEQKANSISLGQRLGAGTKGALVGSAYGPIGSAQGFGMGLTGTAPAKDDIFSFFNEFTSGFSKGFNS